MWLGWSEDSHIGECNGPDNPELDAYICERTNDNKQGNRSALGKSG